MGNPVERCCLALALLSLAVAPATASASEPVWVRFVDKGPSACHDVLAMTHAGLPTPRLYPGSWSEWITDPLRPRATGDEALR